MQTYIEKFGLLFNVANRRIASFSARPLCGLALVFFAKTENKCARFLFII